MSKNRRVLPQFLSASLHANSLIRKLTQHQKKRRRCSVPKLPNQEAWFLVFFAKTRKYRQKYQKGTNFIFNEIKNLKLFCFVCCLCDLILISISIFKFNSITFYSQQLKGQAFLCVTLISHKQSFRIKYKKLEFYHSVKKERRKEEKK